MIERLPPGLHIVATPIGNLGDLSPRAADTRSTAMMLTLPVRAGGHQSM